MKEAATFYLTYHKKKLSPFNLGVKRKQMAHGGGSLETRSNFHKAVGADPPLPTRWPCSRGSAAEVPPLSAKEKQVQPPRLPHVGGTMCPLVPLALVPAR